MKAVVQRVSEARVEIGGLLHAEIGEGLLTFLAVEKGDEEDKLRKFVQKIVQLRIFPDEEGKMNRSLIDIGGEHLLVSQFTLAGDCSKGRRPHFQNAEEPDRAKSLYKKAVEWSGQWVSTKEGEFAADMQIFLVNNGPVTILL